MKALLFSLFIVFSSSSMDVAKKSKEVCSICGDVLGDRRKFTSGEKKGFMCKCLYHVSCLNRELRANPLVCPTCESINPLMINDDDSSDTEDDDLKSYREYILNHKD
jgi:hypothetical protein